MIGLNELNEISAPSLISRINSSTENILIREIACYLIVWSKGALSPFTEYCIKQKQKGCFTYNFKEITLLITLQQKLNSDLDHRALLAGLLYWNPSVAVKAQLCSLRQETDKETLRNGGDWLSQGNQWHRRDAEILQGGSKGFQVWLNSKHFTLSTKGWGRGCLRRVIVYISIARLRSLTAKLVNRRERFKEETRSPRVL